MLFQLENPENGLENQKIQSFIRQLALRMVILLARLHPPSSEEMTKERGHKTRHYGWCVFFWALCAFTTSVMVLIAYSINNFTKSNTLYHSTTPMQFQSIGEDNNRRVRGNNLRKEEILNGTLAKYLPRFLHFLSFCFLNFFNFFSFALINYP